MLCDRCGLREATGGQSTVVVDTAGNETRTSEQLCHECFEGENNARMAQQAEIRKRLEGGSIFEEIRHQLKTEIAGKGAEQHAAAAEFIDLLRNNLDIPLPDDLVAFADRHRRPSA